MNTKRQAAPVEGVARRKRRSAEEIMDKLMAAAKAEFTENGYGGATTAAIARRGEMTEAQLFRYFPSKAELFREAVFKPMTEHIGRFNREASNSAWDEGADRDRAKVYISELQAFLREHSRMLMSLLVARAYGNEPQSAASVHGLDRYFERGAETLAARLGRRSSVAPELTVRVSFASLLACVLLDDWLFPPGLASRDEIDAAIETFIVNGIASGADPTEPDIPASS